MNKKSKLKKKIRLNKTKKSGGVINSKRIGCQMLKLLYKRLSTYNPIFKYDFWNKLLWIDDLNTKHLMFISPFEKNLINSDNNNNIRFRINLYSKFIEDIKKGQNLNPKSHLDHIFYTYPFSRVLKETNDIVDLNPKIGEFYESLYNETTNLTFLKKPIKKENINIWLSLSHGMIESTYNKKTILPENVALIYITPINRYGIFNIINSRIDDILQSYSRWINIQSSSNINVCDILKMIQSFNCFSESSIFLPGQEYLDVKLSFQDPGDITFGNMGVFKYDTEDRQVIDISVPPSYVSDVITKNINNPYQFNIYFVLCCRMCDSTISNTFTERIYIYEAFYGLLNSLIINNLSTISIFDISYEDDCEYSSEMKDPIESLKKFQNKNNNIDTKTLILNKSLSPNKSFINKLMKLIQKNFNYDIDNEKKEKEKEIDNILLLSKSQEITLSQFEKLINAYNNNKYMLFINDLTKFNLQYTFLYLLVKLMIDKGIKLSFIIGKTNDVIVNILKDKITELQQMQLLYFVINTDNILKILSCLTMIYDEIKKYDGLDKLDKADYINDIIISFYNKYLKLILIIKSNIHDIKNITRLYNNLVIVLNTIITYFKSPEFNSLNIEFETKIESDLSELNNIPNDINIPYTILDFVLQGILITIKNDTSITDLEKTEIEEKVFKKLNISYSMINI